MKEIVKKGDLQKGASKKCVLALAFIIGSHAAYAKTHAQTRLKLNDKQASSSSKITQSRTNAPLRLKVGVRQTRLLTFDDQISFVSVVMHGVLKAEVRGGREILFTGLAPGETMVVVFSGGARRILLFEVTGQSIAASVRLAHDSQRANGRRRLTGSHTVSYAPANTGSKAALMRQLFSYRYALTSKTTLRADGDLFKFFNKRLFKGSRALSQTARLLGVNRLTFGASGESYALDVLDSRLKLSALGFDSVSMRGIHLVLDNPVKWFKGLELFAGFARPSQTLFDDARGRFAGVMLPLTRAGGRVWARAGAAYVKASREDLSNRNLRDGLMGLFETRYTRSPRTSIEGGAAYAPGSLSWRARFESRRESFSLYAEASKNDRRSPLFALGARANGGRTEAAAIQWHPQSRFKGFLSIQRTSAAERSHNRLAAFDGTTLQASGFYQFSPTSRAGVRVSQQTLSTYHNVSSSSNPESNSFQMRTRSLSLTHSAVLLGNWSHEAEARFTSSRETRANAPLETGISLREEVRRSFERWQVTGFFNLARNAPSLESLIVRNPALLPEPLRSDYESDPARFLAANRDALPLIVAGVALPERSSTVMGVRVQGGAGRVAVAGEARYGADKSFARGERVLLANLNATVELDDSSFIGVNATKALSASSANPYDAYAVSYTHRIGGGSKTAGGKGFGIGKLLSSIKSLGAKGGRIEGRVFQDLNGNGRDDEGEPGVSGMLVRLDEGESVKTDSKGRYRLESSRGGERTVTLVTDALGVNLQATTPSQTSVHVSSGKKAGVDFGVSNYGAITGRVFNDFRGDGKGIDVPGVAGVRLKLTKANSAGANEEEALTFETSFAGAYEFRGLLPGDYVLEIDGSSLPPNFSIPSEASIPLKVAPLRTTNASVPLRAQRAIAGQIFIDKNSNGKFDPQTDETVEGARVSCVGAETVSGKRGEFILRNLPAGRLRIRVYNSNGQEGQEVNIELDPQPQIVRGVNLIMTARQ